MSNVRKRVINRLAKELRRRGTSNVRQVTAYLYRELGLEPTIVKGKPEWAPTVVEERLTTKGE
jgi:hypothetical protein